MARNSRCHAHYFPDSQSSAIVSNAEILRLTASSSVSADLIIRTEIRLLSSFDIPFLL